MRLRLNLTPRPPSLFGKGEEQRGLLLAPPSLFGKGAEGSGSSAPRGGYVIFAVLIVIVVLSLVAYRFAESMTSEYRAGVRGNDDTQAKLAAVSGLHYAAAVLSDRETFYGDLDGNPFDNPDVFEEFEVPAAGGAVSEKRRAYFSVRAVALTGPNSYEQRFGVIDEGGKLNVNSLFALDKTGEALRNALMKLPDMTEDVADAIVDWVDPDDDARAGGAESAYYLSLSNPYKAKNAPLNSLDELLLVKGMTPELLYGGDRNRNGVQDEGETDSSRGWADYLTVYGRELNLDMTGTARIYLNGEPDTMLQQLRPALGDELATYIVACKLFTPKPVPAPAAPATGGQPARPTVVATLEQLQTAVQVQGDLTLWSSKTKINSLLDFVGTQITLPRVPGAPATDPDVVAYSPLNDPAKRNELLAKLMDKATVKQAVELVPRINVNTAPREVLLGVPGLTEAEADAIISLRGSQLPTEPATVSAAWLLTTDTLTTARYKQVEKYLTGATMVYRVQSIGYFAGGGQVARMEAVIDTNQGAPRFLLVRDLSDLENPRGFQPQQ